MASHNLVRVLQQDMSLSVDEIGYGLEKRGHEQVDSREIQIWLDDAVAPPDWVKQAAGLWIIEFWMNERDSCEAQDLLKVDEKYTRLLRDFSMGEIIAMRNRLTQQEVVS